MLWFAAFRALVVNRKTAKTAILWIAVHVFSPISLGTRLKLIASLSAMLMVLSLRNRHKRSKCSLQNNPPSHFCHTESFDPWAYVQIISLLAFSNLIFHRYQHSAAYKLSKKIINHLSKNICRWLVASGGASSETLRRFSSAGLACYLSWDIYMPKIDAKQVNLGR